MESILLTAISTIPYKTDGNIYTYKDIETQKCICQLEPVFDLLTQKHKDNIHIIAICTEETLEKNHILKDGIPQRKNADNKGEREISAVDYTFYRLGQRGYKQIDSTSEDNHTYIFQKANQLVTFTIFKTPQDNYVDCLKESTKQIKRMYKNQTYHLWINANGGFRDMYLLIVAIISLMKVDHVFPNQILLTNDQDHKITNVDENFRIFDFVSGMNDFITFGHVNMLEEYYHNKPISKNTKELITDINETYLGLQFNNYDYFENAIKHLNHTIRQANQKKDIDQTLLTFLPIIEDDFGTSLLNSPNPILMIKRCIDKKMYQHAATLIETNTDFYSSQFFKCWKSKKTKTITNYYNQIADKHYLFENLSSEQKNDVVSKAIQDFSNYYRNHLDNGVFHDDHDMFISELKKYEQHLTLIQTSCFYTSIFPSTENIHRKAALSISIYQAIKAQRNKLNHAQGQNVNIDQLVDTMKLFMAFMRDMMKYQGHPQVKRTIVNISGISFEKWPKKDFHRICNNGYVVDLDLALPDDGQLTEKNLSNLNDHWPKVIVINEADPFENIIYSINKCKKKHLLDDKEYWMSRRNRDGTITLNKYYKGYVVKKQEDDDIEVDNPVIGDELRQMMKEKFFNK